VSRFSKTEINLVLASHPERHRIAFAAACAERLLPHYELFSSAEHFCDPAWLYRAVDLVWDYLKGNSTLAELIAIQEQIEAIVPDTDDFESLLASRALDAASATAQLIDLCREPTAAAAAEVAEIAWESAFGLEQDRAFDTGGLRFARNPLIADASGGGLVQLEEQLQRDSLTVLAEGALDSSEMDDCRVRFGRLGG